MAIAVHEGFKANMLPGETTPGQHVRLRREGQDVEGYVKRKSGSVVHIVERNPQNKETPAGPTSPTSQAIKVVTDSEVLAGTAVISDSPQATLINPEEFYVEPETPASKTPAELALRQTTSYIPAAQPQLFSSL